MTKKEFLKRLNCIKRSPRFENLDFYLCLAVEDFISETATRYFENIFDSSAKPHHNLDFKKYGWVTAGFGVIYRDQRCKTRIAAIELFEHVCLQEKYYKEF